MTVERCALCEGTNVDSWGCRDCFGRRMAFTPRDLPPAAVSPDQRVRRCPECGEENVENDFVDRSGKTRPWCSACRRKWAKAKHAKPEAKRKGKRTRRPRDVPWVKPPRISAAERERRHAVLAREMAENETQRQRVAAKREAREYETAEYLAILTVFIDTGVRLSEMAGMKLADVDLPHRRIKVLGKGGKERMVPLGDKAQLTLDRYLRARRRQRRATSPKLWLGHVGDGLGTEGIAQMLRRRCRQAGLAELHPHQLRHTFADAALDAGGSEGNLMETADGTTRPWCDDTAEPAPPVEPWPPTEI